MPGFTFRLRFPLSPRNRLNIDASKWEYRLDETTPLLILCSYKEDDSIKNSKELVFKSDGWPSAEDADVAARKYSDALLLSLAKLRIGADFGGRAPKPGGLTRYGLDMFEAQAGRRVLNEVPGISIYESELNPLFVSLHADVSRGVNQEGFERVFSYAVHHPQELPSEERLSHDLFHASFFQKSADSRFLMLVMAIEALLKPSPRSPKATAHIESLVRATQESANLSEEERRSLLGSLKWLFDESINQTGRRLAENRLGSHMYGKRNAPSFFSYCYKLRSRLVHGMHPLPEVWEISSAAAQLEVFVSDLLSGQLLEVEPYYRTIYKAQDSGISVV